MTFDTVRRTDAGNYTVTATNFALRDPGVEVGSDTGSFFLDVLCKLIITPCACATGSSDQSL